MKRFEARKLKEQEKNQLREIMKFMNHFVKDLFKKLNSVKDPRHQSYTKYEIYQLLFVIIMKNVTNIETMSGMTTEFNTNASVNNFKLLLGDEENDDIPHYVTINNLLKRLKPEELERVKKEMIKEIIRRKTFNGARLFKESWKVIIDATYVFSFNKRHCEHCLTQTFNRGKENEHTVYSHKILEAKLILSDDIIISIGTEFIENEGENVTKQDSELKAFKRLSQKMKKDYPRLPIVILADSLYANETVMNICADKKWDYIIRFKDGSIPTLAEEFYSLVDLVEDPEKEFIKDTCWINKIDYKEKKVNIFKFLKPIKVKELNEDGEEEEKITTFKWLTNLEITEEKVEELIDTGRERWKIENEGFNIQKNKRYNITHVNSTDYNAMKNHYQLIQIADVFLQIYTSGNDMVKKLKKSIKKISSDILKWLTTTILSKDDISYIQKRTTIHFV